VAIDLTFAPADAGTAGEAADVLARAFENDPGARLLYPPRRRIPALRTRFAAMLERCGRDTILALATGPIRVVGCVVWSRPDRPHRSGWNSDRRDLVHETVRNPVAAFRMAIAGPWLTRLERRCRPAGAWSVHAVGVDPALQGRGIGGELMRLLTADLDRAGASCYLETAAPRNIGFYSRYGFRIAGETTPPASVRTVAMTREPRTA
jgi:ribosomal protein S18 acetylase RimI-like enzyme